MRLYLKGFNTHTNTWNATLVDDDGMEEVIDELFIIGMSDVSDRSDIYGGILLSNGKANIYGMTGDVDDIVTDDWERSYTMGLLLGYINEDS